jgi:hypothetical protein
MNGDKLMVPYTEDRVKDTPQVADTEFLSDDDKRELYLYYGLEFPEPTLAGAAGTSSSGLADVSRGPEISPPSDVTPSPHETVGAGRSER